MNALHRTIAALLLLASTAVAAHGVAPKASLGAPPAPPPAATPPSTPATPGAPATPASPNARNATMSLLDLANRHNAAPAAQQAALLAQLVSAAHQRFDALTTLAAVDPAEVLRVALPANVLASLPPQAIPFLERPADEAGDLEVIHVDHVNTADDYYIQTLVTTRGRFPLYIAGDAGAFATGDKAHVRGVWLGNALVAASENIAVAKASALPNTFGAQRTLVIMVNFSDAPTQPYTAADARNVVFGTTSNYDYEASYQQTTVAGDVAGWFTIASTTATCDYNTIASQARTAATSAGFVLSNYNRYVYVFPSNSCGWWGLGTVGGNPSHAWVQARYGFTLGVVGHEMGHNLGLWHSHSMDCGTSALAASGCTTSDYGDSFDLMGGNRTAHYNAFQKERLGWLNYGVSPPLTTVPTNPGTYTYTISPLEDARNTASRALKIPRGTACAASSEFFYVEARQARGFDAFLAGNANVLGGVLIHKAGTSGDTSYLLDMTPETSSWTDAALVAGRSWTDPVSGVTIAPVSVTSTGAQVNVTYPPASCTRAAPSVSVTPTGTVWTSAGASVNYSVSVTNRDSCGCAATTYDVSGGVPAGWSSTSARTSSVAPGATTATSIAITTSSAATAAFYNVALRAANSAAATMVTSGAGTVAIAAALAVGVSSDRATYTLPTRGNGTVTASIRTNVQSGGTAVSGASVSVTVTDPSGRTTTLSGTTSSSGVATVSYGMRSKSAAKGTYRVTSRATMGANTGTATTSFVVN